MCGAACVESAADDDEKGRNQIGFFGLGFSCKPTPPPTVTILK